MKPFTLIILAISVLFSLIRCQKPTDPDPLDTTPPPPPSSSVIDSTLLIKDIEYIYFEENGITVSGTTKQIFSYDTVSKKIMFKYEEDGQSVDYAPEVEFSYNESHQLVKAAYSYQTSYAPNGEDFKLIQFEYDNENFLSKFLVTYGDGHSKTVPIVKRKLVGDITELEREEDELDDYPTSKSIYKVRTGLDANHHILYNISDEYFDGAFRGAFKKLFTYNTAGDITKFVIQQTNSADEISSNVIVGEYTSFSTKGNQLYNQQRLLFNGVNDLTNPNTLFAFGGALSQFIGTAEQCQFYNHLFTSAVSNTELGGVQNLQSNPEHDSKGRLLKFRGFFSDAVPIPLEYRLTYYKN